MARYDVGDGIRFSVVFVDAASGSFVDPTTVEFSLKSPSGEITKNTYPSGIARNTAGSYHTDSLITDSGVYWYRWAGSGTHPAAIEGNFVVSRSQFDV